jgi:hypothetical protein
LKSGLLVSKFAFTINLYRYTEVLKYKKVGKDKSSKLHKVEIPSERLGWRPVDTVAAKDAWCRELAYEADVKRKAELEEEAAAIKRKQAEAEAEATRRKDGAEAEEAKR